MNIHSTLLKLVRSTSLLGALPVLFAASGISRAYAQLPCDPPVPVVIVVQDLGYDTYEFTAQTPGGNYTVLSYTWSFSDGSTASGFTAQTVHTFAGSGTYLVCCAVDLLNGGIPCTTSSCIVQNVQSAPCTGVTPDFTATLSNDSLQFIDLTTATDSITGYSWDLGDGTTSSENTPIHLFGGPGPYLICFSVTVLDSANQQCTSTVCHWLYSGPIDPPCEQLLTPYFTWQEMFGYVAFQDSSNTSGLVAQYLWDFGDGTWGYGQNELHAYTYPGSYTVCQTVTLSGPLLTDSCVATYCTDVTAGLEMTGVSENHLSGTLTPWPNPAFGSIRTDLPGTVSSGDLQVLDISGRVVLREKVIGPGSAQVDISGLSPGHYCLTLASAQGLWSGRFMVSVER